MTATAWRSAPLVITALVLATAVAGCAKRPNTPAATAPAPTGQAVGAARPAPDPGEGRMATAEPTTRATDGATARPMPVRVVPREFRAVDDLRDIYFAFDRYDIRPGDARILDSNAAWIREHPDHLVLIEGHADERGTDSYNLALGERRAKATLNYLVTRGVPATRLSILSYGEERPLCKERTEACWAKNRRAHFLVKTR